ncbi:MAG: cytochrome c biogenesis protein CcsA, partial [Duodenibacillus massiliensis]
CGGCGNGTFLRAQRRPFESRNRGGELCGARGFFSFSLFTSNPFARLVPLVPKEGRDLNPILQDVGMIVHPPLLFAGYAGLTIVFAVVASLLMTGSADAARRRFLSGLVFVTWAFLTAGNALGSWWAYTELGWGGWWFWDP